MADIIQLLPDHIANQIAAGEVIQRPSSVVKELIENAIDAGSTEIKLIIKDAGKTLIQIIDNGSGMSETDARMSLERHATSKIKNANDLFSIKTMGFRGEAMASIAAISHLTIKTAKHGADLGTLLHIEGSKLKKQESCPSIPGTNISVKNLFYNVPARRKFLKSDAVELKHIVDEFQRVALAHHDIFFSMFHNDNVVFHLPISNLRQRIISIFGKGTNDKILPIEEKLDEISISGFIGKPENAKKTKGQQYIFVNNRFIKNHYLIHAIKMGYDNLLPKDLHIFCVVFLTINPADIDINVHPTKTEIKFENERLIYNYLRVSVKHALGQYSLTPMIDFQSKPNLDLGYIPIKPQFKGSSDSKNTSQPSSSKSSNRESSIQFKRPDTSNWDELYKNLTEEHHTKEETQESLNFDSSINVPSVPIESESIKKPFQIHNAYIVSQIKSGLMIIDQQAAHERILYEQNLEALRNSDACTQQSLFPTTIELNTTQSVILKEILDKVRSIGFDIEYFGKNSYIIHGTPCQYEDKGSGKDLIEKLIEQYEENKEFQLGIDENIARSLAYSASTKRGKRIEESEMEQLIQQLFTCDAPEKSPFGRKCIIRITKDELESKFSN